MVHVLHILYPGQGGLGTYFLNFVREDNSQKFKHFAVFYGIEPLHEEYSTFCEKYDIPFVYIQKKGRVDFHYFSTIWSYIKEHSIKLVFLHTFSVVPLLLLGKRSTRWIIFDHTSRPFKSRVSKIWFFVLQFVGDAIVLFYEKQERVLFKDKMLVLPKSVEQDVFRPVKRNKNEVFTIGMASRFVAGKHQDILIKVVEKLKDEGFETKCIFVGEGVRKDYCVNLVNELRITDRVDFMGSIAHNQMASYYTLLDAYLHVSDGETICYSIMEAQACGVPILASNVQGINTVISHEVDGLLFNNTVESVAETLLEFGQNELKQQEMIKASLKAANSSKTGPSSAESLFTFVKKWILNEM